MSDDPTQQPGDDREPETPEPLGEFLRRQRQLAEVTLNQFAASVGISNAYLSQIERGLRQPSQQVLGSIASALHLSADALETHAARPPKVESDVLDAIERDPVLTGRQRNALAEMYRSFAELNAQRRPPSRGPEPEETP